MSDWLKKVKGVFIVTDENSAETNTPSSTSTPASTPPVQRPVSAPSAPTYRASTTTGSDDRFTNMLLDILKQNNQPGFDYLEFRESLQSLKNMPMDEATRYQSAFAVAKTMGVSGPQLIQTAQFYNNLLAQEEAKFLETARRQNEQQVTNREQQLQETKNGIAQKEKQIADLTKEITSMQQQLLKLNQETNEAAAKIEATKQSFHASFVQLSTTIQEDIQNMQKYIK